MLPLILKSHFVQRGHEVWRRLGDARERLTNSGKDWGDAGERLTYLSVLEGTAMNL
jgi:hypothetical protein